MTLKVCQLGKGDDTKAAEELLIKFFRKEAFGTPESVIRNHCCRMLKVETCGLFIAEADGKLLDAAKGGLSTV
jgi:hypothetical protein